MPYKLRKNGIEKEFQFFNDLAKASGTKVETLRPYMCRRSLNSGEKIRYKDMTIWKVIDEPECELTIEEIANNEAVKYAKDKLNDDYYCADFQLIVYEKESNFYNGFLAGVNYKKNM